MRLVVRLLKKLLRQIGAFICDQYLVLIFILALGIKLYFFNTYITKLTWSDYYDVGIVCGYLSAAIVFLPLLFVRRHKNIIAILVAFLFSFLILIDTVYYSYFGSIPGIGLLASLGQTKDIGPAIGTLMHWWFIWYFIDVILAIILYKPFKMIIKWVKEKSGLKKSDVKVSWAAVILTLIVFWLTLLPVGLNKLTFVLNKSFDTASTSQYYGLLMAHGIDIVRFIDQETTSLSPGEVRALSDWVKVNKPTQTTNPLTGLAKGKNIIMIQVESLGGFVIDQQINGKEITPNLNTLAKTTQFFPNDRFLYGAGHTSDTDFVANSSYFPQYDASVFVRFGQDDFTSLPKTLASKGYSAFAFHGYTRNFWNRDVALKSLGYQKYYAADNYPKGIKMNMGLNDDDFLSRTAEFIKDQPKPSLSYVITLTSHVPFAIYDQTKELGVNANDFPNQVGGYLENINYVDRMLGKFFEKLKSMKLYDDSLILVYGDHTPVLPAFSAGTIMYDPETVQGKEVPLFIKLPNEMVGKTIAKKGTHLDIMPTILDLLGIKTNQLMFGQSLFATGDNALKVCADQLVVFKNNGDCKSILADEKDKSATIIRYNQFNNLPK